VARTPQVLRAAPSFLTIAAPMSRPAQRNARQRPLLFTQRVLLSSNRARPLHFQIDLWNVANQTDSHDASMLLDGVA